MTTSDDPLGLEEVVQEDGVVITRRFMFVTIAGALIAWEIGFEFGAFDTISYRRIFAVFVVSTVVLLATIVANDDTFATSNVSRLILGLPFLYLLADVAFLTSVEVIARVLQVAILVSFPYAVYVIARLIDRDFFTLPRWERTISAVAVVTIGLIGFYVGEEHPRFLACEDFERIGDYVPSDCFDPDAPDDDVPADDRPEMPVEVEVELPGDDELDEPAVDPDAPPADE